MIHVEQQLRTYNFCTVTLGVILCMYAMLLSIFLKKKKLMLCKIYNITILYKIYIIDLNCGAVLVFYLILAVLTVLVEGRTTEIRFKKTYLVFILIKNTQKRAKTAQVMCQVIDRWLHTNIYLWTLAVSVFRWKMKSAQLQTKLMA